MKEANLPRLKQYDTALFYGWARLFQIVWWLVGKGHPTSSLEQSAWDVHVGELKIFLMWSLRQGCLLHQYWIACCFVLYWTLLKVFCSSVDKTRWPGPGSTGWSSVCAWKGEKTLKESQFASAVYQRANFWRLHPLLFLYDPFSTCITLCQIPNTSRKLCDSPAGSGLFSPPLSSPVHSPLTVLIGWFGCPSTPPSPWCSARPLYALFCVLWLCSSCSSDWN